MYMIDEETMYNGTVYNAILARSNNDEEYIKFLQPRDKTLKCQDFHNNALSELLEEENDMIVVERNLETEEPSYSKEP